MHLWRSEEAEEGIHRCIWQSYLYMRVVPNSFDIYSYYMFLLCFLICHICDATKDDTSANGMISLGDSESKTQKFPSKRRGIEDDSSMLRSFTLSPGSPDVSNWLATIGKRSPPQFDSTNWPQILQKRLSLLQMKREWLRIQKESKTKHEKYLRTPKTQTQIGRLWKVPLWKLSIPTVQEVGAEISNPTPARLLNIFIISLVAISRLNERFRLHATASSSDVQLRACSPRHAVPSKSRCRIGTWKRKQNHMKIYIKT